MTLPFDGLNLNLGNLSRLSDARTFSISAENFTGAKGKAGMASDGTGALAARDLGVGWKISPCIHIPAGATVTLADIEGPGAIQHFWMTCFPTHWRQLVLRFYWDHEESPSVEVPLGDFFCNGWCERSNVNSLPIAVNSSGGFNSYWQMPFRQHARVTLENITDEEIKHFFYQITYTLTAIPEDAAYFHAQWRRSNPLPYKEVHTVLDGVQGRGQYVGVYMAYGSNNSNWWGEGEFKFFMDGDQEYPTIAGTGTEDYFGGAWCFAENKHYVEYSTAYLGFHQALRPDGFYRSQQRFGMYRWHVMDPIRFTQDLKITVQALGWRSGNRYLPLQDDIATTAVWYQTEPHAPFPALPDRDSLEVI
jgi:hypothetical protein